MFEPTSMNLFNPFEVVGKPMGQLTKIATDFGPLRPSIASQGIEYYTPDWLDVGSEDMYKRENVTWDEAELVDVSEVEDLEWAKFNFDDMVYFRWSEPWDI